MYDYIPLSFGDMMFVLGLVMAISPKSYTKKEFQNDENMLAKTKRNGFIVIACGIIVIVVGIIRLI